MASNITRLMKSLDARLTCRTPLFWVLVLLVAGVLQVACAKPASGAEITGGAPVAVAVISNEKLLAVADLLFMELADKLWIPHLSQNGMLERLIEKTNIKHKIITG